MEYCNPDDHKCADKTKVARISDKIPTSSPIMTLRRLITFKPHPLAIE